ncbi:transposase domain-containing protein, partial [Heyndrickxia sporothermodurans]|uniref:transposase domain-containing protein n=1 Tax=Heyndrickxia sporothermodurans TaxID=46224 RepID=UPI001F19B8C0
GRKNFLFSNTPKGARASAIIYSIVETAKENGLNPYYYLRYLLTILDIVMICLFLQKTFPIGMILK